MGRHVNWGILGAANFAARHMGPAIHAARDARLVALATSHAEKSSKFKAFAPDIQVFDDYDALLADPGIDAVYIPLPNHLHVEWAARALKAGKHVLCEKPIALRAGEIDGLAELGEATGRMIAEAFMIVHHPQWQRARDLIAAGAIGELRHADTVFSYENSADTGNIRNRAETGGGGVRDIGVYTYGSIRFATGAEPVSLSARWRLEHGVDTWAQAVGEMEGPGGRFTYSAVTSMRMSPRQEVTFQGTTGVIRLSAPFNAGIFGEARLALRGADGRETVERWPGLNQYVLQVENFGRSLRDGADYPCPLAFSRGTQAMIDMVFENAVEIV